MKSEASFETSDECSVKNMVHTRCLHQLLSSLTPVFQGVGGDTLDMHHPTPGTPHKVTQACTDVGSPGTSEREKPPLQQCLMLTESKALGRTAAPNSSHHLPNEQPSFLEPLKVIIFMLSAPAPGQLGIELSSSCWRQEALSCALHRGRSSAVPKATAASQGPPC